jgi:hypothetical protein
MALMRSLLLLLGALAATAAFAQSPARPAPAGRAVLEEREPLPGRTNQKVERIRHEDAGSRIDEVRYAGQTQSITVQPKADVPEYEVQPSSFQRGRPADHREGISSSGGQRMWNLLRF